MMPGLPAAVPMQITAKAAVTISAITVQPSTGRIAMTTIPIAMMSITATADRIISIPTISIWSITTPSITVRRRCRLQRTA